MFVAIGAFPVFYIDILGVIVIFRVVVTVICIVVVRVIVLVLVILINEGMVLPEVRATVFYVVVVSVFVLAI